MQYVTVTTDRLVHGGQAIGTLEDGQKVFVWNALPGETVEARVIKRKRSYLEAIAETISVASPERIAPQEVNYLATSPWQIMTYQSENVAKRDIALAVMAHEKVALPDTIAATVAPELHWQYRNKMEYSFWGDDQGLHLALHMRGSHGKEIVQGSRLAMPAIDAAGRALVALLNQHGVRASDLKTVVLRCDQQGNTVAALYVKLNTFIEITLPAELKGLRVYHSNPKSPASVPTSLLYELGDCTLTDTIEGTSLTYDVDSFFQVHIPIFKEALAAIARHNPHASLVDMYAGVGSIGLSLPLHAVTLVELDEASVGMARRNAEVAKATTTVVAASAEASLDYITNDMPIIVDPPRAGLHPSVTKRILEQAPPCITYLSCNPATQARDLAQLQEVYEITHFGVYNFFPHTPHIETLAVLTKR